MMEKKIIRSERLGEEYIVCDHESGLRIMLYPMPEFSSSYALFGTKYGSIDTMFRIAGEEHFTEVPEGIAHYLEHKLFESEDGDAFSMFAKTGASANAFTTFDKTCYLFSTTQEFNDSLRSLMQFVQRPYFTAETVAKEQGIIAEEIKMYEDNPSWRVYFNLLRGLYHHHPVHTEIAGTVESIQKIDAELLYRCYHVFYNLNNMAVAIAGNFNPDEAISIIEEELLPCEKITVERSMQDEPEKPVTSYIHQKMKVAMPLFYFAFKEKPIPEADMPRVSIAYDLLLDIAAGDCSTLFRRLYDDGLVDSGFDSETLMGRGYSACIFGGYSKDPKAVSKAILDEFARLKQEGIDPEMFECAKKSLYGAIVGSFDNAEEVASTMLSAYFCEGADAFVELDEISAMTIADVEGLLKDGFDPDTTVLSVISDEE